MKKTLILIFCLTALLLTFVGCQKITEDEGRKLKSYLTLQDAPEEARPYLQGTKELTAEILIELSEKGYALSIEDFKDFRCDFYSNSSEYLFEYRISDNLVFDFLTDLKDKESESLLLVAKADTTSIDIRGNSDVAAFIRDKAEKK